MFALHIIIYTEEHAHVCIILWMFTEFVSGQCFQKLFLDLYCNGVLSSVVANVIMLLTAFVIGI